jgi:hypothetical protein
MYSKGVSWIDDCRIPHNEDCKEMKKQDVINSLYGQVGRHMDVLELKPEGRFPANILVSDDMLNDGIITKQSQRTYKPTDNSASLFGNSPQAHGTGIGDSGSSSRYYNIDKWFNNLIDV